MPPEEPPKKKFVNSLGCIYVVSVLGGWNAEIVTYPLDLTKTRLQIQGELANVKDEKLVRAPYRGSVKTAIGIVREEGFFKLWQGIYAVFCRHIIYSGLRLVVYKWVKEEIFNTKPGSKEYFPVWKSAACGVTAGAIAQYFANPADLLKVHLQMEGKRRIMGLPPRVHGLYDAYKKVVSTAGYKGLWKGSMPNVQRAAFVTIGDISAYDVSKRLILKHTGLNDNAIVHTLASFCAGFSAAVLGTPADVIKTRVMNQPVDEKGRGTLYRGTIDCAAQSIRNEGVLSLYKGFFPMWIRLAPWAMTFWLTYEQTLRLLGADQF